MSRNNSASSYMDRLKQKALAKNYVQWNQVKPLDPSVLLSVRLGQQPKTVMEAVVPSGSCQVYNLPVLEPGCCCDLGPFIPFNSYNKGVYYYNDADCPPSNSPPAGYNKVYVVGCSTAANATTYSINITNSANAQVTQLTLVGGGYRCFIYLQNISDTPGTVSITATNETCSVSTEAILVPKIC